MDPLTNLRVGDWTEVLVRYATSLAAHGPALDRLDVSRGDPAAGTALRDTMASSAGRLGGAPRDFATLAAWMRIEEDEARGESGRCLEDFLGGMADAVTNADALDATGLAMVLEAGADAIATTAERSVPMSDVARRSATAALATADGGGTVADVALAAADAGLDALEATAQYPELAEAGVVDAAAAGLVVFLDVLVGVVHGEELETDVSDDEESGRVGGSSAGRYLVQLDFAASPAGAEHLDIVWRSLGEAVAIVAAGDPDHWHGEVATDDIGAVIEAAIEAGRPSAIVVEDMQCRHLGYRGVAGAAP